MNHITIKPQDSAVLVLLSCAFSWGTKTDKEMTGRAIDEAGAVNGSVRVRKTLLPAASGAHVKSVQQALTEFSQYHNARTYGTSIRGQRIMPSAFYMDYMEKYGEARAKARGALDTLMAGYDAAIEQAKPLLGSAFKAGDYPPVSEIEEYFTLNVRFLPVPAGDQIMNALGATVAAGVNDFVGSMLKVAANDAKDRLRSAVKRMAERLTTKDAKIYDTMPAAITELSTQLPAIAGITDDAELAAMVEEVKHTLSGYTGEDFRKSEALKTEVGSAAMAMLKKMGGGL